MNISVRKKVVLTTGTVMVVSGIGLGMKGKLSQATSLFDSPTFKWGAILSAVFGLIAGAVYLLANKNALKRKVTEYGEVSFVVCNGNPRTYRWGKRKGQFKVRRAGQGKNVIPKLRDQVTVSWLLDIITFEGADSMYKERRIKYDVSIEYSLPEPTDDERLEVLRKVAFEFRDRNRYDEGDGSFESHLTNRVREAVERVLPESEENQDGLPVIDADGVNWLQIVGLNKGVTLETLRVSLLNMHFPAQVELR